MPEVRLETVFPEERHDEVLAALQEAHPYEEPAFDVYPLAVKARLFTDGGSRGNPGPAAAAYVLETEDGHVLAAHGEVIGVATNNVAEYRALVDGLAKALELGVDELEVVSDSELVVKQMNGEYKVKNAALVDLSLEAAKIARQLGKRPLPVRAPHAERAGRQPRERGLRRREKGGYNRARADVAQLARASACHAEGRGFESHHPLH